MKGKKGAKQSRTQKGHLRTFDLASPVEHLGQVVHYSLDCQSAGVQLFFLEKGVDNYVPLNEHKNCRRVALGIWDLENNSELCAAKN